LYGQRSKLGIRAFFPGNWVRLTPFAWATVEAWYPRIFPWQLGYSQLELIPLLQIADLTGSIGIGFVMTAIAAIPTIMFLAWCRTSSARERRFAAWYLVAALALLAGVWGYGEIRRGQWTAWIANQPKLKIAAVQVDPAYQGSEERLRNWTLPIRDQVDLICWPESSIGVYSESLPHFRDLTLTRQLSRDSANSLEPAKDFGRHFLAGGKMYRANADELGPYFMTAFLVGPDQDVLGRYHKRTLLPFGEYVPGQSYYPAVREWFTLIEVMEAGSDARPLITEQGHRLGVLICYEDTRPASGRQTVAQGAQALFSLIQGTAFENPLTLRQHQRLAVMRAVENRRYFVRCASTGVSCVVAPSGEILADLPLQTEGVLLGEIALIDVQTVYTRTGNLFAWICTLSLAVGFLQARPRIESRNARLRQQ
jgi:apolipoprotein N-acyltransferase